MPHRDPRADLDRLAGASVHDHPLLHRALVADEDGGIVGQGTGDSDALLLAAGKLAGVMVGTVAQANALYYAKRGEQFWEGSPQAQLRSVLGLYTEDFTIVAAVDAEVNSLADLKGKTVNIGELGSTDNIQAKSILGAVGLDLEQDLEITEKPAYEASELLQSGDIDAYFYTVGHPNLSIKEAASGKRKVMIVSPGQKIIDDFASMREDLLATEIPIDYYTAIANREPVPTVGVKAILFCSADTDEQTVYNMVKEVFENLDLFTRQHPAFANLTPEKLSTDLIVPLHPGAERYFRGAGVLP